MTRCNKWGIDCPYAETLQRFGQQNDIVCAGSEDQCWHWRHPRVPAKLEKVQKKPNESRSIELEDDE